MERVDNRLAKSLSAMFFSMTLLSCICYATIFVQPNVPFNPLSPSRATAIAAQVQFAPAPTQPPPTLDQSYPPTWTPTPSRTPGPTKTPTSTRTQTPTKTSTPTPFPYIVTSHSNERNCADVGLKGVVNGSNGLPQGGLQVQYGELGVSGSQFTTTTDGNGRYGALLLPGTDAVGAYRSHTWYAYVLQDGKQASDEFTFTTDPIYARNPSHCDGLDPDEEKKDPDADDDDEDDFTKLGCLPDPCRSSDAIQIKIINWQAQSFGN
ncbi:MAG: hypothetical protein R3264_09030 [Anaerolineae bacterium]|nr:hypothetical protein [Anaerolineae bacterium]